MNWELQKRLGTGGFGDVLLWRNKLTKLEIATKIPRNNINLSEDETAKLETRWRQEFEWIQNLDIAYIVRGVDVSDPDFLTYLQENHAWHSLPVIVMEYCNGGDLRKHLEKAENLNGLIEFEVREVMRSLRHAIEYLHDKCRIEHRDLKPDNIVIHHNGRQRCYKLTDFGFARRTSENTIGKSVVGTRHYFAPEVVDTARYTQTVDYWSLGIIAFELMCGTLPFIPHQDLFQIITNIKKKPADCIAITENPDHKQQYHFQALLPIENRISHCFRSRMEHWLRLALDKNYKTRGKGETLVPPACDEVQMAMTRSNVLRFYTELDAILESKILTVFCLNTYKFYTYEVTSQQSLWVDLARDTQIDLNKLYVVFPTGHPVKQLSKNTRPLDIFVAEWQDTSDKSIPPCMLYLVGYQCQFTPPDPIISSTIKKCLSCDSNEKLPQWLLRQFSRDVHHLLSNEQLHLKAFVDGLKEYALTLEHEVFNFDVEVQQMLDEILKRRGSVDQFQVMIHYAREAYAKKLPDCSSFFDEWKNKMSAFNDEIKRLYSDIGQATKRRYNSALRRIKEEATSPQFDECHKSDHYSLVDFRLNLNSANLLDICQKAVYNCMEKRKAFQSKKQFELSRTTIDVHEEFRKIRDIVRDCQKFLSASFDLKLAQSSAEFMTQLIDLRGKSADESSNYCKPLKIDGSITEPYSLMNGHEEMDGMLHYPTDELIQTAEQNMRLLSLDWDADMSEIPATIEFK